MKLLEIQESAKIKSLSSISCISQCILQLVLNSIDANASEIEVVLNSSEQTCKVSDNGDGVNSACINYIGKMNYTSKTKDTLYGYKGEALASIANISNLEITTRSHSTTHSIIISNGIQIYRGYSKVPRRTIGTTLTITDLFSKFPIRRKTNNPLKIIKDIKRFLEPIILVSLGISFLVIDQLNKTKILSLRKCNDSMAIFKQLFEYKSDLYRVDSKLTGLSCEGFVGSCQAGKRLQFVYLNGKFIVDEYLYDFINKCFNSYSANRSYSSIEMFPVYLLKITCSNDNFTTSLGLVKFRDWPKVQKMIQIALDSHFLDHEAPVLEDSPNKIQSVIPNAPIFTDTSGIVNFKGLFWDQDFISERERLLEPSFKQKLEKPISFRIKPSAIKPSASSFWAQDALLKWDNPIFKPAKIQLQSFQTVESTVSRSDLNRIQVIGQIDKKFIACRVDDRILIFDQHAVDERIQLERLLESMFSNDKLNTSRFETNVEVKFSVSEHWNLKHRREFFKAWGFIIDENYIVKKGSITSIVTVVVSQVPYVVFDRLKDAETLELVLRRLLNWELESGVGVASIPAPLLDLIKSKACRSAIMFGRSLSNEECCQLIRGLIECKVPFQCAHGRPSVVPIATI